MTDRASAEGCHKCGGSGITVVACDHGDRASAEGLREADWYVRESDGARLYGHLMSKADIAALRDHSDSGTHGHDVPGVGYLWWDASGKIIGGPEDD